MASVAQEIPEPKENKAWAAWLLPGVLAVSLLASAAALFVFAQPVIQDGRLQASLKWQLAIGLAGLAPLALLALLVVSLTPARPRLERGLAMAGALLCRLGRWNLLLYGLLIGMFCLALLGRLGGHLLDLTVRVGLFWWLSLAGAVLLWASGLSSPDGLQRSPYGLRRNPLELLASSALIGAAVYRAAVHLGDLSDYPFTMAWSEASRYYYASLFFAEKVYGSSAAPTVLHPSRYLMQALPFLISDSPLWLHRLWQVLLWWVTGGLSAWLLVRRVNPGERLRQVSLAAFSFTFLLLGPVYYHLLVPVIVVLAGYNRRRPWQTLAVVLLASAWAGISRVNWYPVPAMLAIAIYLLEEPLAGRALWRYLLLPFAWGVSGLLAAAGAQALYVMLSGNAAEQFTSSFTSDLLWSRLLPNPTYPPGILLMTVLVSLPPVGLAAWRMHGRWKTIHPIRHLGLAAMLLVLLAGGLVVSVKIGGGSNLHNLDAYLALLLVCAAYIFYGRYAPETGASTEGAPAGEEADQEEQLPAAASNGMSATLPPLSPVAWVFLALGVLTMAHSSLTLGGPPFTYNRQVVDDNLARITRQVQSAAQRGPVLFIGERQLLTFGYIPGVPLVADYERVFLMEMAMSGSQEYLGRLYEELSNQRFALIVGEPLFVHEKGSLESFGEENDAWVANVARPILCYYEPVRRYRDVRVVLLEPRQEPGNCP